LEKGIEEKEAEIKREKEEREKVLKENENLKVELEKDL